MSKIVKDTILFSKLITKVLKKCYEYQLCGIDNINYEIFYNKTDIFLISYRTSQTHYITIKINVIDFIEHIKRPVCSFVPLFAPLLAPLFNANITKTVDYCVECNKIGNVFKYKRCGHKVHVECSLQAVKSNNRCKHCNTSIIDETIYTTKIEKKDMCSICLEDTNIILYNCGHHFHEQCLMDLSKTNSNYNNKCPMCRNKITDYVDEIKIFYNTQFSLGNNRDGICNIQINTFY